MLRSCPCCDPRVRIHARAHVIRAYAYRTRARARAHARAHAHACKQASELEQVVVSKTAAFEIAKVEREKAASELASAQVSEHACTQAYAGLATCSVEAFLSFRSLTASVVHFGEEACTHAHFEPWMR